MNHLLSLCFTIPFIYMNIFYNKHCNQPDYKIAIAAFYNCENFYDTSDDPQTKDEEFLPEGERHYTQAVYLQKLNNIARVIHTTGIELSADGPAIFGLSEVESRQVVADLAAHPLLRSRNYQIIHYDSKDVRGVDAALLYNPKYFIPDTSGILPVLISGEAAHSRMKQTAESLSGDVPDYSYYSRDVLWVSGKLDGESVLIYVNHWPSRLGGASRTAAARRTAALVCKHHLDSVRKERPTVKVIVMGDFNDDPISPSIQKTLRAGEASDTLHGNYLINPWIQAYKHGNGTLAYQDAWGLFDQIIISASWLSCTYGFRYHAAHIVRKDFMLENSGRYKGYPLRFWDGMQVRGGFSDHLPVYVVLLKPVTPFVSQPPL